MPILIIGDREFHSSKLAKWLQDNGIDFILRQKQNSYVQILEADYEPLKQQGFEVGDKLFYHQICCNKAEELGEFNLAVYWQRPYRGKRPKDIWYLLTSLSDLETTLAIYRLRWGIEMMFQDCKTGGYNLEDTHVNQLRFLARANAYSKLRKSVDRRQEENQAPEATVVSRTIRTLQNLRRSTSRKSDRT